MSSSVENQPPLSIPPDVLSEEALHNLIESFILREGTDYGMNEVPLDTKRKQVLRQIQLGEVIISFDPSTESVSLILRQEWKRLHTP